MKRHFKKNREAYQSLVGGKKTQRIEKLQKEFITQKLMFKKSNQESQASSRANYVVAYEIAKQGKPFLEGELVKNCMLEVAEIVCRDEQRAFQNVSLSRITITRRVEKIGSDFKDQLDGGIQKYVSESLVLDESTDIGSTAELLIFIQGITKTFKSRQNFSLW